MINDLISSAMMAIVRTSSTEDARSLGRALIVSGVKVLEFTTTCPDVFSLVEEFTGRAGISVGVGTVLTIKDVANAKSAGASFIVSPNTDAEIIVATKNSGLVSIPGVATASDVANSIHAGADALKIFPASTYGPRHLRALRDPFPNQVWVATGGVTLETIGDWIQAGASAFGLGGPLMSGGLAEIDQRVELFKTEILRARKVQG